MSQSRRGTPNTEEAPVEEQAPTETTNKDLMTPRVLRVLHRGKEILPELSNKAGVSMLEGRYRNRKLNCKTTLVMK